MSIKGEGGSDVRAQCLCSCGILGDTGEWRRPAADSVTHFYLCREKAGKGRRKWKSGSPHPDRMQSETLKRTSAVGPCSPLPIFPLLWVISSPRCLGQSARPSLEKNSSIIRRFGGTNGGWKICRLYLLQRKHAAAQFQREPKPVKNSYVGTPT